MAGLAPGILVNLLDGMNREIKPTGEHRSSLLQVTDIVPADLDEKDLWPNHGFYIKVSDSSHSIYVSLPIEEGDLVLSNQMQLGQFIHADRLEPGSPVPTIKGAKPLPGRHPMIGTPEPIMGLREKGEKLGKSIPNGSSVHRRGSWEMGDSTSSPSGLKPAPLDFNQCTTLIKEGRMSTKGNLGYSNSAFRGSVGSKMAGSKGENPTLRKSGAIPSALKFPDPKSVDSKAEKTPLLVRKSCAAPSSASKSQWNNDFSEREPRVPRSPLALTQGKSSCTRQWRLQSTREGDSFNVGGETNHSSNSRITTDPKSQYSSSIPNNNTNLAMNLPAKLSTLGKEAVQQRKMAQKLALEALRDASATETIVQSLKMLSNLSKSAKPEAPSACFNQFLDFHCQIKHSIAYMISIRMATGACDSIQPASGEGKETSLRENSAANPNIVSGKSKIYKSTASIPEIIGQKANLGKKQLRCPLNPKATFDNNDEKEALGSPCSLSNTITLAEEIETEAGIWFMEFLEKALEVSTKKKKQQPAKRIATDGEFGKIPQSLVMKVMNWVELEQCGNSSKQRVHPRTAQIARKLRMKMRKTE